LTLEKKINRFQSMADVYDKMAPILVPQYHFLQDTIIRFFHLNRLQDLTVVDLGGGSGIFLEKILRQNPRAEGYLIDASEDFLGIAREKLSIFKSRVHFLLSPIEASWETEIENTPDFIFSMSAIHHLEDDEKKALYRKCYSLLRDTGWLLNLDEMKTRYEDSYLSSMLYWVDHVENAKGDIPVEDRSNYEQWRHHFDDWKRRNIDQMHVPKSKGEDIHTSFLTQMEWLKEIGFYKVDILLKYQLWCAICGQRSIAKTDSEVTIPQGEEQ
jgi:ubiquinone/menaquinone biosynthesis C-methylase UbiE